MKICISCDHRFESADWQCPQCDHVPPQEGGVYLFSPYLAKGNGGFKSEHFAQLADLEAGHFWFRHRNRLLIWVLQTLFPQITRFLEIGCGTGFVLSGIRQALPQIELNGSGLFIGGLRFARQRLPGVQLHQMDALQIPFEAEFDAAGAFDVLEHIPDDETVLRQLYEAIKPGGGLLLTVPQHPSLCSAADVTACHQRRYNREELVRKVASAGFKTLRVTSFISLLLPLRWLSRRRNGHPKQISASDEFQVNRAANSVLGAVLAVERAFIQFGANFPAGGSLLLAAQKI